MAWAVLSPEISLLCLFVIVLILACLHQKRLLHEVSYTIWCVIVVSRQLAPLLDSREGRKHIKVANLEEKIKYINSVFSVPARQAAPIDTNDDGVVEEPSVDIGNCLPINWDSLTKELLAAIFCRTDSDVDAQSIRLVSKAWSSGIAETVENVEIPVVLPPMAPHGFVRKLPTSFPCASHLILHNNQTCHPNTIHSLISQVAACKQIQALDILDAQFWACPWELPRLTCLQHLTSLSLAFQVADREKVSAEELEALGVQCGELTALKELRMLRVWLMSPEDELLFRQPAFFVQLQQLSHLHTLAVNCAYVSDKAVELLLQMPCLTALTLHGDFMGLGPYGYRDLLSSTRLRRLELSQHYDWQRSEHDDTVQELPDWAGLEEGVGSNLEYLQLPLTPAAMRLVKIVPMLTSLRRLFVQEPLHLEEMRPFSQNLSRIALPPLLELFVDGFTAHSTEPLEALAALTSLTSLTLCNSSVLPEVLDDLTLLTSLTALEDFVLDLENPNAVAFVGDDVLLTLAQSWTRITALHLDLHVHSEVPDPPLEVEISAFSALTTLRNLSIHHTGTGLLTVDALGLPPALQSLCLYGVLVEELYCIPTTLQHLRLSAGSLTASDIYVIPSHLPHLRTLMLKKETTERHFVTASNIHLLTQITGLESLGLSVAGSPAIGCFSALTRLTRLLLETDESEGVDEGVWYSELMRLTTLTRLRSLWLSEGTASYASMLRWQNQLQHYMPLCVLQLVENDRFWTTDIIMNEAIDWWMSSAWPSLLTPNS